MPVVLVTGGARRLGKQIALAMAREKWDVAIHYGMSRWPAEELVAELNDLGVQAYAFDADLTDETKCQSLLPRVIEKMGSVQAIVNNASAFIDDNARSFAYQRFIQHMQINTAAGIVLAKALYEHICASEEGRQGVVINMLDQKLWNLNPDHLSYTLSKAALKTATEMLARELAPQLRIVGIAPGLTLPPPNVPDSREFLRMHQMSPLGQSSTVDEITQAVSFAIRNRALTGSCLIVDGGQHLMHLPRDISKL